MANASRIRAARSWPLLGAVLAAIGASSCCIVPIIGALLGVSTLGAGAALGGARPLFMLGAAVLLFIGGRGALAARREDACGCEGEKTSRFPAVLIIVGAAVLVGLLAFVPELVLGGGP